VDLRNAIAGAFGVDLPATAAFDYPTASALCNYIAREAGPPSDETAKEQRQRRPSDALFDDACGDASDYGSDGSWDGGSDAAAAEAGSKGSDSGVGLPAAEVLTGVRAAVAEALGASVGDEEPLMEVGAFTSCRTRLFHSVYPVKSET